MKTLIKLITLLTLLFLYSINLSAQKKSAFHLIDIPSPSLQKSIIEPKSSQKVGIYLPPGYNDTDKKYPVVYFLTGYTVHPGEFPPMWIDSIVENKIIRDVIYVEISGYNMFEGTMYANSPVTGNWEDFVTKDVILYIDKNYRTLAKRESRGIAGHSMGGGGCFNICLKHSDKYSVAYPMSPAIATKDSLMTLMFSDVNGVKTLKQISDQMLNVSDKDYEKKLKELLKPYNKSFNWPIAYGIAFASDVSQGLKFEWPVEVDKNNKIIKKEKAWKNWEDGFGDIENRVEKYKNNLLSYKHLAFDCGYKDEIRWIYTSSKDLIKILTEKQIPFSVNLYDGTHVSKVGDQMVNRVMPIMDAYLEHQ